MHSDTNPRLRAVRSVDDRPDVEVEVIVRITDRRGSPLTEDDHHRMCFAADRTRDVEDPQPDTAEQVAAAISEAADRAMNRISLAYPRASR